MSPIHATASIFSYLCYDTNISVNVTKVKSKFVIKSNFDICQSQFLFGRCY